MIASDGKQYDTDCLSDRLMTLMDEVEAKKNKCVDLKSTHFKYQ